MIDLDRPVTLRELRAELQITKTDLRAELETVVKTFATKEDLKAFATKEDLNATSEELRRHFDVTAESFRSEFRNLFDWVHANTTSLARRVEAIETGHGSRLLALETHVTGLESDRSRS